MWVKIQSNNARVGGGGGVVVLSLLCESWSSKSKRLPRLLGIPIMLSLQLDSICYNTFNEIGQDVVQLSCPNRSR